MILKFKYTHPTLSSFSKPNKNPNQKSNTVTTKPPKPRKQNKNNTPKEKQMPTVTN